MGRTHRSKNKMIEDFNKILEEQGCRHKIIDVKSHCFIIFSNGFIVDNKSEVDRFLEIFNKHKMQWFSCLSWWFEFPISNAIL